MKKKLIGLGFVLFVGVVVAYRSAFYTPPLLASGGRGVVDGALDFLASGWHLTRGSFIKDYLKDDKRAYEDFFMVGWYRERYLRIVFRVTSEELDILLAAWRGLDVGSLRRRLYAFSMGHPEERAGVFRTVGGDFLRDGDQAAADRSFACILKADPENPVGALSAAGASISLGQGDAFLHFLRLFLQDQSASRSRS